jgi:hypothetical protein
MKQMTLVAIACSLLVVSSPVWGQQQNEGSMIGPKNQEASIASTVPCGTRQLTAFAEKGLCRCPPMPGASVSGCGGHDPVDCGLKMCQYKRFDIQSGEVVEKGEVDCEWHPYGYQ